MPNREILRVRGNIKEIYGKLSKYYNIIARLFGSKLTKKALELLNLKRGEHVLEIGFGTGNALVQIAKSIGDIGYAYGIDITPEMVNLAKKKLLKEKLFKNVRIIEGDARDLPYNNNIFDAVYIAETLELFDVPDIPKVLSEIKRVLKPSGTLAVVSLSKEGHEKSFGIKIYEWIFRMFPRYSSCRPIYIEDSLKNVGYKIIKKVEIIMGGLMPMRIVIANPIEK